MKLFEIVRQSPDWDTKSEKEQTAHVRKNPSDIKYIENPSEFIQLLAVNSSAWVIKYIEHPTEAVQNISMVKWPSGIRYIKNPTQEALLIALKSFSFINMSSLYNHFIKEYFANNTILMKKWLRYGETMREES